MARGGEKDFGKEAIDTLVKAMEDHKTSSFLFWQATAMRLIFMDSNPGLYSRFPIQMDFPDYNLDQLIQISELMAKERDYILMPQSLNKLKEHLQMEKDHGSHAFSNARYVRNVIEKSIRNQSVRSLNQYVTGNPGKLELMTLRPEDFKLNGKIQ